MEYSDPPKKNPKEIHYSRSNIGFPGGSAVRNKLAMQEMLVQSLEREMTTHSSILA